MKIFILIAVLIFSVHAANGQDGLAAAKRGDYSSAYTLWEPIEQQKNPEVQYLLAYMFDRGYGIKKNKAAAITWYNKAALQGHLKAQYKLGSKYITKDADKALYWITKAAKGGYPLAQYTLAEIYKKRTNLPNNRQLAIQWYKKAAAQGITEAEEELAQLEEKLANEQKEALAQVKPVKKHLQASKQTTTSHQKKIAKQDVCTTELQRKRDVFEEFRRQSVQKAEQLAKYPSIDKANKAVTLYYPNKQKHISRTINNNGLTLEVVWYANGQKKTKRFLKQGRSEGEAMSWYQNGQLQSRATYHTGLLFGTVETWYKNGQSRTRSIYKDGKLDGPATVWYENGQKEEESRYSFGLPDGNKIRWYSNGVKALESHFKYGEINGKVLIWYQNGKQKAKQNYKVGKLDGLQTTWKADGKKQSSQTYRCGAFIKKATGSLP